MDMQNLQQTVVRLQQEGEELKRELASIKGRPAIQGYAGKRLDLNDNLNVVSLKKQIADLSARITALEEA